MEVIFFCVPGFYAAKNSDHFVVERRIVIIARELYACNRYRRSERVRNYQKPSNSYTWNEVCWEICVVLRNKNDVESSAEDRIRNSRLSGDTLEEWRIFLAAVPRHPCRRRVLQTIGRLPIPASVREAEAAAAAAPAVVAATSVRVLVRVRWAAWTSRIRLCRWVVNRRTWSVSVVACFILRPR